MKNETGGLKRMVADGILKHEIKPTSSSEENHRLKNVFYEEK